MNSQITSLHEEDKDLQLAEVFNNIAAKDQYFAGHEAKVPASTNPPNYDFYH